MVSANWLIARYDELDIEAHLFRDGHCRSENWVLAHKAALRRIDQLKIAGKYEGTREWLARYHGAGGVKVPVELARNIERTWMKLHRGMESPDPEERAAFRAINDWIDRTCSEDKEAFFDSTPITEVLTMLKEPKKPRRGRPKLCPPWRNVVAALDDMRFMVAGGAPIDHAARAAAGVEKDAYSQLQNRVDYLADLFKHRAALRE